MKFSTAQAQSLARQIKTRFGAKIDSAVKGSNVPPEFLAGLISVEAGKRNGLIVEDATRFEAHVFAKLQAVRDGSLLQYNSIRRSKLKDATDDSLRALAKSYGLTQTMGWWAVVLDVPLGDFRNPEKHLGYAVQLLDLNAKKQIDNHDYDDAFRIWNTGKPTGRTHDVDYVYNATKVMSAYQGLPDVAELEPEKPAEKPEEEKKQEMVETVGSTPPVVEVKTPSGSITSKIAAATAAVTPILTATGFKIGGIQFSTLAVVAFLALIGLGLVVGAILWDRDRQRQLERQRLSIQNLADPNKGNVVAQSQ